MKLVSHEANAAHAACEARCKTEKHTVKWKSHEMENPPGPLPSHNRPFPLLFNQSPHLLYVSPMRESTDYGKTVGKQERDDRKMQNGSAERAHSALDTFREYRAGKDGTRELS